MLLYYVDIVITLGEHVIILCGHVITLCGHVILLCGYLFNFVMSKLLPVM